jgi:hypothetical protein
VTSPGRAAAESRWLLDLVAGHPEPPPAGLDAAGTLALAREHRLAPRAGSVLAAAGLGEVLPELTAPLVRDWRLALGEEALFAAELERIAAAAAQARLPLVALKGADLARRLYGPGERPANDLDLLAPAARLEDAAGVLERAGFVPAHPAPALAREHWFAVTWRSRRRPRVQVDLHWDLGRPPRARWPLDAVLARSEPLPGLPALGRLAPEDLAVHLALHAVAFHGAAGRWLWWLDLFLLERELGASGRAAAGERAAEVGGAVALAAAHERVTRLFGARPGEARSPARARLAARLGRWGERPTWEPLVRRLVAALALDRPADLVRLVGDVLRRRRRQRQRSQSER